jgi:hypothetical protein
VIELLINGEPEILSDRVATSRVEALAIGAELIARRAHIKSASPLTVSKSADGWIVGYVCETVEHEPSERELDERAEYSGADYEDWGERLRPYMGGSR